MSLNIGASWTKALLRLASLSLTRPIVIGRATPQGSPDRSASIVSHSSLDLFTFCCSYFLLVPATVGAPIEAVLKNELSSYRR